MHPCLRGDLPRAKAPILLATTHDPGAVPHLAPGCWPGADRGAHRATGVLFAYSPGGVGDSLEQRLSWARISALAQANGAIQDRTPCRGRATSDKPGHLGVHPCLLRLRTPST